NVTLPVKIARSADFKGPVQVTLFGVPQTAVALNNNKQPLSISADKTEATATLEVKAGVPPGTYTLVLRGLATVTGKDAQGKPKGNTNLQLPTTPLSLVVTAQPQLGKITLEPRGATWKPGTVTDVLVKVKRMPS